MFPLWVASVRRLSGTYTTAIRIDSYTSSLIFCMTPNVVYPYNAVMWRLGSVFVRIGIYSTHRKRLPTALPSLSIRSRAYI
jgi:hypothetical protein